MIDQLNEQIKIVVEARQQAQKALGDKSSSYAEWEIDNTLILDRVKLTTEAMREAEDKLRELTLLAYSKTGNKAPASGVGIRVKTILSYLVKEAMEWAMEHKLALKLDSSAFEKIAKTSNLPFVTITEEPTATIATQLEEVK